MRDPAHARRVEAEATALRTLGADGYPVPALVGTTTVDGRPGLVTERASRAATCSTSSIGGRCRCSRRGGSWASCTPPCTPASPSTSCRRSTMSCADRLAAAEALPDDLRPRVLAVLDGLPQGDRLCHGDMHIGNVLGALGPPP